MAYVEKTNEHLICFDSDGTVMDSMNTKHINCFGPAFIKVFNIDNHKQKIIQHWIKVNLYSKKRGINRFLGLEEIIDYSKKYGYKFDGEEEFDKWVHMTKKYSIESIEEYMDSNKISNDNVLKKAIEWSIEVNSLIKSLPDSQPFEGVVDLIKELATKADLVGVSSAPRTAVESEWKRVNIYNLFKAVACQDAGKKSEVLKKLIDSGYKTENIIMIGDALGDYEAAKIHGIHFYPITPNDEVNSWKFFSEHVVKRFLSDQYKDEYEEKIIEEFINDLE